MSPTANTSTERLSEKIDRLSDQIAELAAAVALLSSQMGEVREASDETRRTLRGSNGAAGLVARVDAIERTEAGCRIHDVLRAMDGDGRDPGLAERVRNLEALANSIRKFVYLIGGLILADLFARLWPALVQALAVR